MNLCDTVTVEYPELGVSAKAKCIRTVYDVLKGRYARIELGDARANIADTILSQEEEIKKAPTTSYITVSYTHLDVYKRQALPKTPTRIRKTRTATFPYLIFQLYSQAATAFPGTAVLLRLRLHPDGGRYKDRVPGGIIAARMPTTIPVSYTHLAETVPGVFTGGTADLVVDGLSLIHIYFF